MSYDNKYTDKDLKQKSAIRFFQGLVCGALATATGVWFAYDHWQPLVVCAIIMLVCQVAVSVRDALE